MCEAGDLFRMKRFDIADRLIDFAVAVIQTSEQLPATFAGNHLAAQLTRSGTAPALHYGEAQSAESGCKRASGNLSLPADNFQNKLAKK